MTTKILNPQLYQTLLQYFEQDWACLFLLSVDDPLGIQRKGDHRVGIQDRSQVIDRRPLGLEFQYGPSRFAEEPDQRFVQPESPVEGQTVRKFAGPESEDMYLLTGYLFIDLGDDRFNVPVDLDVRTIDIAAEDAVRAAQETTLNEVDGFVSTADVVPCPGAVSYHVSRVFYEANLW